MTPTNRPDSMQPISVALMEAQHNYTQTLALRGGGGDLLFLLLKNDFMCVLQLATGNMIIKTFKTAQAPQSLI